MGRKDYKACTGDVVTFQASRTFCKSYQWDFGDGNMTPKSLSRRATHKYEEAGSYIVSLTVCDGPDNKARTISVDMTVKDTATQTLKNYWFTAVAILLFAFAGLEALLNFDVFEDESTEDADPPL